jgi:hypothetical protein
MRSALAAGLALVVLAFGCDEPRGAGATTARAAPDATIAAPSSASAASSAASSAAPVVLASAAPPVDAGPRDAAAPDASAPGDCPEGMAKIGRTCVDRWEAHLVEVDVDGGVTVHPHNERPAPGVRYEARTAAGVFPQAYVSRVEAKAACAAAGKRLCSRAEWTRACEGRGGKTYPYGRLPVRGRCNVGKAHLLARVHGADSRKWRYDEDFNDPSLDAEPGFLARSGEYEGCGSDDGVFDLVGNLHEWVSDTIDQDFVDRFEAEKAERRRQPWKEGNGVFLGGFFSTIDEHGPGCTFTTIAHEPSYHDYSIGFRCCAAAAGEAKPKR